MIQFYEKLAPGYEEAFEAARLRQKFEAIAATTATGRPTVEQLKHNGMLPK